MQVLATPSPGAHFWALPDHSAKHPGICCSCVGKEQAQAPIAESLLGEDEDVFSVHPIPSTARTLLSSHLQHPPSPLSRTG